MCDLRCEIEKSILKSNHILHPKSNILHLPFIMRPTLSTLTSALFVWLGVVALAHAEPPRHYLHAGAMPPGAIGGRQLMRGGPLPGYYQPIEIRAADGVQVAYAME